MLIYEERRREGVREGGNVEGKVGRWRGRLRAKMGLPSIGLRFPFSSGRLIFNLMTTFFIIKSVDFHKTFRKFCVYLWLIKRNSFHW